MRKIALFMVTSMLLASPLHALSASATAGGHCVYQLVPIRTDSSGVVRARLVPGGCFATFAEAILVGSGGSIRLSPATAPASLTDRQLGAQSTTGRTSVLIGTEYDSSSFGGASHSYFAAGTCTASTTWEVANVTITWNDVFQSGKGFGGCDTNKKFRDTNFGGTVVTCTPNCTDYGALDNQVSSLRWRA
jgi:hypothetical protein